MKWTVAALFAAVVCGTFFEPAASAHAQAAAPFPEVPLLHQAQVPHKLAYASLVLGAGLIGASFTLEHRADEAYARYLAETDLSRIDDRYDDTVRYDRLSSASLISGEVLLATGVYLRFLRRPLPAGLVLSPGVSRCALALRF
jgi:hypothetical protein